MGTGVAAALPVSGVAAATAQRSKYIFAVALAHNRTDVSAEMISEMFNVRPGTARGFIRKMVRNGVVDAPNAQGIARLTEPLQRIASQVVEYNPAGGYVVRGKLDELAGKAREMAERMLDESDAPQSPDDAEGETLDTVHLSNSQMPRQNTSDPSAKNPAPSSQSSDPPETRT